MSNTITGDEFYCWHKDATNEDACKVQCESCKPMKPVNIPLTTQESEDELYDEVERIFDKHTRPTGGGYEADYTDRSGFINDLLQHFSLTRKQQ